MLSLFEKIFFLALMFLLGSCKREQPQVPRLVPYKCGAAVPVLVDKYGQEETFDRTAPCSCAGGWVPVLTGPWYRCGAEVAK